MSEIIYVVENHEDEVEKISEQYILKYVEDNIDDIASLKKKFTNGKTIFRMTLFVFDLEFTADEYINHYSELDAKIFGPNFFTDVDTELIRKLNF